MLAPVKKVADPAKAKLKPLTTTTPSNVIPFKLREAGKPAILGLEEAIARGYGSPAVPLKPDIEEDPDLEEEKRRLEWLINYNRSLWGDAPPPVGAHSSGEPSFQGDPKCPADYIVWLEATDGRGSGNHAEDLNLQQTKSSYKGVYWLYARTQPCAKTPGAFEKQVIKAKRKIAGRIRKGEARSQTAANMAEAGKRSVRNPIMWRGPTWKPDPRWGRPISITDRHSQLLFERSDGGKVHCSRQGLNLRPLFEMVEDSNYRKMIDNWSTRKPIQAGSYSSDPRGIELTVENCLYFVKNNPQWLEEDHKFYTCDSRVIDKIDAAVFEGFAAAVLDGAYLTHYKELEPDGGIRVGEDVATVETPSTKLRGKPEAPLAEGGQENMGGEDPEDTSLFVGPPLSRDYHMVTAIHNWGVTASKMWKRPLRYERVPDYPSLPALEQLALRSSEDEWNEVREQYYRAKLRQKHLRGRRPLKKIEAIVRSIQDREYEENLGWRIFSWAQKHSAFLQRWRTLPDPTRKSQRMRPEVVNKDGQYLWNDKPQVVLLKHRPPKVIEGRFDSAKQIGTTVIKPPIYQPSAAEILAILEGRKPSFSGRDSSFPTVHGLSETEDCNKPQDQGQKLEAKQSIFQKVRDSMARLSGKVQGPKPPEFVRSVEYEGVGDWPCPIIGTADHSFFEGSTPSPSNDGDGQDGKNVPDNCRPNKLLKSAGRSSI